MRRLAVESLTIRAFRNLARVDLDLGARFNVLSGDNGQGKTNFLECAYLLATSRSFRTTKLTELVSMGATVASIRGVIREGEQEREQSVGLQRGIRAVRVDGKRPATLAAYAVHTPTVVFHPGAIALAAGSGAERRKLLDRLALYLFPASLAEGERYAKAVRGRQRALELRGERSPDLDGWEELMAQHGLALSAARARAADALAPAAEDSFTRIGSPTLPFVVRYARSAPVEADAFRTALVAQRARDRARGSATLGPHRDDLSLPLRFARAHDGVARAAACGRPRLGDGRD